MSQVSFIETFLQIIGCLLPHKSVFRNVITQPFALTKVKNTMSPLSFETMIDEKFEVS